MPVKYVVNINENHLCTSATDVSSIHSWEEIVPWWSLPQGHSSN